MYARQPVGTNLCAYYACKNLRSEVTEGIDFQIVSEQYTDNLILLPSIVFSVIHNICYDDLYSYWSPSS
jgi:hypothetical protein